MTRAVVLVVIAGFIASAAGVRAEEPTEVIRWDTVRFAKGRTGVSEAGSYVLDMAALELQQSPKARIVMTAIRPPTSRASSRSSELASCGANSSTRGESKATA